MIAAFLKLLAVFTVFGQLPVLLSSLSFIQLLLGYYGGFKLTFYERILQYFNFIFTCFFKPAAGIDHTTYQHISYQLYPVTDINIGGICLLLAIIAGFILNAHKRFARICLAWCFFSFLILAVIGWGTMENGLVLYSLYFSWAGIALIFMGIQQVLSSHDKIKLVLCFVLLILLLQSNLSGLYDLIGFGMEYYPF